jgi:hypothetical protein
MSLDPTTNETSFNFYQHQHHNVAKSSKNAYGCPTSTSVGGGQSSHQNMSMMHFDEQSFIRNLLTNDRVLNHPSTGVSNLHQ